jgi:hypothetical protein
MMDARQNSESGSIGVDSSPRSRLAQKGLFRREGEYWTIGVGGKAFRLTCEVRDNVNAIVRRQETQGLNINGGALIQYRIFVRRFFTSGVRDTFAPCRFRKAQHQARP